MRDSYFFNEENFLFVARRFFPKETLRQIRKKIPFDQSLEFGVLPDQIRCNAEWFALWEDMDLVFWKEYLSSFDQIIYPPMLRIIREEKSFVPWHQDEVYMKNLGPRAHTEFITCFVPLDEEPCRKPTLQFYIDPCQQQMKYLSHAGFQKNQYFLSESDVPDSAKCSVYDLELGDVLIFGKLVLHRTYFPQNAQYPRCSMEFRITKQRTRIRTKDYFNLHTKQFYQFQGEME